MMLTLIDFKKSTRPTKKYMVIFENDKQRTKTIHFGNAGSDDYIKTKDDTKKENYIKRHKKRENWKDPLTAGFWSRWILWNKKTLEESFVDTIQKHLNQKIYGIKLKTN